EARSPRSGPDLQLAEVLLRAEDAGKDLLVAHPSRQRRDVASQSARVRRAVQEALIIAPDQILPILLAREDDRGHLPARGAVCQGLPEGRPPGQVDGPPQAVAEEGVEEAVVGTAAAGPVVFRRSGEHGLDLLDRAALVVETQEVLQADRVR